MTETVQPKRVIVTGSRKWLEGDLVDLVLDEFVVRYPHIVVVHGHCPTGADHYADLWAESRGHAVERHPANWELFGKGAGFIRNVDMAKLGAVICFAFWDGKGPGTLHMITCATKHGIPVAITPRPLGGGK